jgi:outer membrane protein assembly factor BamB
MSKDKIAAIIAMFLIFAMAASLIALPIVNAQAALVMNLPGSEGVIDYALIHSEVDIDLNGGPGADANVSLFVQYPGRPDFTYIDSYITRSNGDLDVYDFDFNETGVFYLKWALPPDFTEESNVEGINIVTVLPPTEERQRLTDLYDDMIPTWVYGVLSPNPVGVGQEMTIVMFNPQVPHASSAGNDIRYEYSVSITKPDQSTVRIPSSGTITSDSTGTAYTTFTPEDTGNYSVTITFHELYYHWNQTSAMRDYTGVTLQESSRTYTLVVQDEPVEPVATTVYPLPVEYWKRPIEGQNDAWGAITSNWLNNAHDKDNGYSSNRFQTEGVAPNSGHILWTKVTEDGGVVGGDQYFSDPGEVFNAGHQYQTRFTNQIIMWGRLYYELPITWSGGGGGWMCVDLLTGEEVWGPIDFPSDPSFGYYYDWDDMNQHGVTNPGWIFTNNFANSIHPRYGTYGQLSLEDVPRGTTVMGPKGENIQYVIDNEGSFSNPDYHLKQWNSSKVFTSQTGTRDAGDEDAYDWNVPLPIANDLSGSISIRAAIYNDVLLCSNGSFNSAGTGSLDYANEQYNTLWAVSLEPGKQGQRLFGPKNFEMTFADGSQNLFIRASEGVFVMEHFPTLTFSGYSMYTGEKLWEGDPQADINPFGYFGYVSGYNIYVNSIAYGKLFTAGYTGHVFCYDLQTGNLDWVYEAPTKARIFEYYTLMLGPIADGKIYVGTHEHSADTPLYKGNRIRCLNVTTGEEIWTMLGWANAVTMAEADGVLIYWNNYDHQVYAVGKGPSDTDVLIQNDVVTYGDDVHVKGWVTDVSAGTQQDEQARRFPDGVPAVSDASQSEWMEYVYMQKPRPTNVTGVEVIISVLDPNNNCYEVGRTTGDADGFFKLSFTPEVPGDYTVIATFEGSESYWQSHATTSVHVSETPEATAPPTPTPAPMTDTYVLGLGVGAIVAIIAIGLVIILMLRKR